MTINVRVRDGMCPDPTTGDGGATEGDIRGSFSDIIDTIGVVDLANGHCLVTENSPAALSVLVAPGVVYIPNADYDELDSNTVKFWEAIITVSTAVTITANTSGSARVDLVCAKMDTAVTPDEHASNIATLVAVAGTPGAGAPTLPDNYAKLAEVEVANGASTIVTADITDSRVQAKINSDYIGASVSVTTKGDLQTHDGSTPARLAVGSDGYIPRAKSAATNGIEWTPPYNSLSYQSIINGGFTVNQRGYVSNATLAAGVYGHDRWKAGAGGGDYTFTQLAQATTITIKTGKSLIQVIENKNVIGGTYTLSWTGTAQARFGINSATPSGAYAASPITITTQTAGTVMSVEFNAGTLGKVVLANSSVALPFMPKSFEEELRACQRYYEKSYNYADAPGANTQYGMGVALSRTTQDIDLVSKGTFKVSKRTTATVTFYSVVGTINKITIGGTSTDIGTSLMDVRFNENNIGTIRDSGSGLTANTQYWFQYTASAEL